ncbi:hypothetical protein GCM10022631_09690 [Deinococcus rubellus]|uniref:hypothetical protein n=1 Tax=Deinococcus rubellus TaxID=1889240 RepID=UPI0031F16A60
MSTAPTTHHSLLGNTTLTLLELELPAQHLLEAVDAPAALAAAVMDDLDDAQRHTRTRLSFL